MMAALPPDVWGYKEWLTVAQIVITIIGMGVGPWLAVRWSIKQFKSQKRWASVVTSKPANGGHPKTGQ